jgi:hypothetical protein
MNDYTADNNAELNALVEMGVCSKAKATRAMTYLTQNFEQYREENSGMSVSDRVDLALACV